MLTIIDASALLAIGWREDAADVFEFLDDETKLGRCCWPDEVQKELQQRAKGEISSMWIKAAGEKRCSKGPAYQYCRMVNSLVRELVDDEAQTESSAPIVLAHAVFLRESGLACIVTEDYRDKPTRIALATACTQLDVPWMRLSEYLDEVGYPA